MKSRQTKKEKKRIVILGGGFAGVRAALDLSEYLRNMDNYEIILIDKRDYHTYYSALYEAATAQHEYVEAKRVKSAVTIPLSQIFTRTKVKVFKGFIENVDIDDGKIYTDSQVIYFDYLVTSMGSVTDFFGIPGLDKFGFTLKSVDDAIMIRNKIEEVVSQKEEANLVIGGGGFAGVEFAGEVYNLLKHECKVHKKNLKQFSITIVEGGPGYLSGLSGKVSNLAQERLKARGINARFSTLLTEAGSDYVMLDKQERLPTDVLIWTGGVRSCRVPFLNELEIDKKDRTYTTKYLNTKQFTNVFIAGDNLCFIDKRTKKPLPQTAQEAIRHGSHVAKNIYRLIRGKELMPYSAGPTRFVIPISGKYAIMYTKNIIISGFVGWVIRRLVDLRYFLSILPLWQAFKLWWFETDLFIEND
jgi:NADH:ubiquinone reductase (H+-translocating)